MIDTLPAALSERVRPLTNDDIVRDGECIVYWMHHAMRVNENPALDVACVLAEALEKPLLIYAGLGGNHRYHSDRHHTFILEGAADVAQACAVRGLTFRLHVPQSPRAASPLPGLGQRAAVVITEDFPAPPFPKWMAGLAQRIAPVPVWAVDTACIVPMQLAGRAFDRAFAFRDAMMAEFQSRVRVPAAAVANRCPPGPAWRDDALVLGFEPVSLVPGTELRERIANLVARCDIDHGIAPVAHTKGGTRAGDVRWEAFFDSGLKKYAVNRNDAARDGVSRLSAYFHYGMISPMRIAREAAAVPGAGSEKFLDELFTWREVSHNLCFYRAHEIESLVVLPRWARATLEAHARDPREYGYTREALARGRTHSRLWNAAQRSLLIHGELHNNVRMTWAKALAQWAPSPQDALSLLIDLNHRYALDGSDPNSYGGLLWALGLFDRPFTPEVAVLGTVRPRSVEDHERRLDVSAYERLVSRPATGKVLRFAVIGSGIAGGAAARTLHDHGHDVALFDKGRGPGGRASTRREGDDLVFDHGAQYFTARDERFTRVVEAWIDAGIVARWEARMVKAVMTEPDGRPSLTPFHDACLVGVPGMNALARHLCDGLETHFGHEITSLGPAPGGGHELRTANGEAFGPFDGVVVSCPSVQTAALLADAAPEVAERASAAVMTPCWAVMAAFGQRVEAEFDAVHVTTPPQRANEGMQTDPRVLSWAARDSSKPGRVSQGKREMWVLHASPSWTLAHLEMPRERVAAQLLEAFEELLGQPVPMVTFSAAHRWRYALAPRREKGGKECGTQASKVGANKGDDTCHVDPAKRLVACGDWCIGPRIESAYLSGIAAAGRLLGSLSLESDRPHASATLFYGE